MNHACKVVIFATHFQTKVDNPVQAIKNENENEIKNKVSMPSERYYSRYWNKSGFREERIVPEICSKHFERLFIRIAEATSLD